MEKLLVGSVEEIWKIRDWISNGGSSLRLKLIVMWVSLALSRRLITAVFQIVSLNWSPTTAALVVNSINSVTIFRDEGIHVIFDEIVCSFEVTLPSRLNGFSMQQSRNPPPSSRSSASSIPSRPRTFPFHSESKAFDYPENSWLFGMKKTWDRFINF